jgi:hypothetical protein
LARVSESAAGLRFVGDDLDPAEISAVLGRTPTTAVRRGEVVTSDGVAARGGAWTLDAEMRRPADLDRQIAELLSGLTPDLERWLRLADRYKAEIFCGLFLGERHQEVAISHEALASIAERGLAISFVIYHEKGE